MAIELLHTQSFKKYKNEVPPEVLDHVREWAKGQELKAFHEDKSLIKVTGTKDQLEALHAELREKLDYTPPDPKAKKK